LKVFVARQFVDLVSANCGYILSAWRESFPGSQGGLGHDFLQTVKFSQIRQADRRAKAGHSLDTGGRGASMGVRKTQG
jgi:hypothetical protein